MRYYLSLAPCAFIFHENILHFRTIGLPLLSMKPWLIRLSMHAFAPYNCSISSLLIVSFCFSLLYSYKNFCLFSFIIFSSSLTASISSLDLFFFELIFNRDADLPLVSIESSSIDKHLTTEAD